LNFKGLLSLPIDEEDVKFLQLGRGRSRGSRIAAARQKTGIANRSRALIKLLTYWQRSCPPQAQSRNLMTAENGLGQS
jgi:hypothetical protein